MSYTDKSVPFGSHVVTINAIDYIFENVSIKRPVKKIPRPNQIGEPNGFVLTSDYVTGSSPVQITTSASDRLVAGRTFTYDFGNGSESWVIGEADEDHPMNGYWKQNVTFHLSPNPPA